MPVAKYALSYAALIAFTLVGALLLYVGTPVAYGYFRGQYQFFKPVRELKVKDMMRIWKIEEKDGLVELASGLRLDPSTATFGQFLNNLDALLASQSLTSPPPVISIMFEEWPLLSACTTGLGTTIMLLGISCIAVFRIPLTQPFPSRDWLLILCVLAIISVWMSITSNADASNFIVQGTADAPGGASTIHVVATAAFIGLSLGILFLVRRIFAHFAGELIKAERRRGHDNGEYSEDYDSAGGDDDRALLKLNEDSEKKVQEKFASLTTGLRVFGYALIFAAFSGILIIIGASQQAMNRALEWTYPFLIVTELLTLELCGAASGIAVYCYLKMDLHSMKLDRE